MTINQDLSLSGEPRAPLQNRVTPCGDIVFSKARGTLMGNRGRLHDEHRVLGQRQWTTQSWVACLLAFRGRTRTLMQPGRYTELFFLDEVTALAAGHRPCATCRREDFHRFIRAWAAVAGRPGERVHPPEMDRYIHAERVDRHRRKIVFEEKLDALPDGVIVKRNGAPLLKWRGMMRHWSLDGYCENSSIVGDELLTVLTPRPIVEIMRAGYCPGVHPSAGSSTN